MVIVVVAVVVAVGSKNNGDKGEIRRVERVLFCE
jgi:hypothetical protein